MKGFTFVELIVATVVLFLGAAVALPMYQGYVDRSELARVVAEIDSMAQVIQGFRAYKTRYPDDLVEAELETLVDPWGRPYEYFKIEGVTGKGGVRKDKNLNPINTDFDLYSVGRDGLTKKPLTAPQSHDDIIRAGNGSFIGVAEDF